ncbi:hypothetical protein CYMTET_29324, partial [Cymbomonas tetramitiformis]
AESNAERDEWIGAIQGVIATLLENQPTPAERPPGAGSGHMRQHSTGGDFFHRTMSASSSDLDAALLSETSSSLPNQPGLGDEAAPEPLQVLWKASEGNTHCADCGAPDPDWASLNLNMLLCIECSGIHRRLGVHISKVRSLTLDVKVWEPSVMALFLNTGNAIANEVWEGSLRHKEEKAEQWLWGADDDEEDDEEDIVVARRLSHLRRHPGSDNDLSEMGNSPPSPVPNCRARALDSIKTKEEWIKQKYVERKFVGSAPLERVFDAVLKGDMSALIWHIAKGYNWDILDTGEAGTSAAALVDHLAAGHSADSFAGMDVSGPEGKLGATALHAAAVVANVAIVELLYQNGVSMDLTDCKGRTALHWSILHGTDNVAKLLLRHGARAGLKDARGEVALDMAMARGSISDEELFLGLSNIDS